jgi:hypothetical protein
MNAQSAVRLLAVDLDDTLLREDLTISNDNKQALIKAEEAGVTVLLASGRVFEAMHHYADELGMTARPGYLISNNGGTITRSDTGELVSRKTIEPVLAQQIYEAVKTRNFPTEIYRGRSVYVDRDNSWTDIDCSLSGLTKKIVPDFAKTLAEEPPVKMVVPGDPKVLEKVQAELTEMFGDTLTIFTSKPFFLEMLPKDADKGQALAYLAQSLGIAREEVMAIGDSCNDLAMIRWAGIGVVMVNGNEAVKAEATYVTRKTNEENGVAEAVEHFILHRHP